jgi:hypothetical protein
LSNKKNYAKTKTKEEATPSEMMENTVGSPVLSGFFSVPYRNATGRL